MQAGSSTGANPKEDKRGVAFPAFEILFFSKQDEQISSKELILLYSERNHSE